MDAESKDLKHIKAVLGVFLFFVLCAAFKATSSFSVNLILSLFIFMLSLPFCYALEKIKVKPGIATILSVFIIVIIIFAAFYYIIYTVDVLIKVLPSYANRLEYIDELAKSLIGRWVNLPEDFSLLNFMDIDWIGGIVIPALRSISGSALSIVKNLFVTLLMSVFLLAERNTIVPKIIQASETNNPEKVTMVFSRTYKQISKYLTIKTLISLLTGIGFYIVCKIAKMDLAEIIAFSTFLLNYIPTFGSIIVTALTILIAMLQFLPEWSPVLFVAISTILLQNIFGNIIEPRMQGNQLNLSPFVILVALSLFGYIWGIVGTFLAVPILSVLVIVLANMEDTKGISIMLSSGSSIKRNNWQKKRKFDDDDDEYADILFPSENNK